MTKNELKEFLIEECDYTPSEVNGMDSEELLDAWLKWYGICGYTRDILKVVKASGINLNNY